MKLEIIILTKVLKIHKLFAIHKILIHKFLFMFNKISHKPINLKKIKAIIPPLEMEALQTNHQPKSLKNILINKLHQT
jgi:hypothetical protein